MTYLNRDHCLDLLGMCDQSRYGICGEYQDRVSRNARGSDSYDFAIRKSILHIGRRIASEHVLVA